MPIARRHMLVFGCGSLLGCATTPTDFRDGGAVPPDRALVLLHLRYTFGRLEVDDPEIGLTRLASGRPPEDFVTEPCSEQGDCDSGSVPRELLLTWAARRKWLLPALV